MSCAKGCRVATALILALAMAALPVQGQVLEDPVTVPVRFVVTTGLIGYNPALNVWAGGGGTAAFSIADTGDYLHAEQPQYGPANFSKLANMAPNRTYTLSMTAMNVHEHFRVYIAAPTGYRVFINEVEQYGLNFTAAPANWVSVPSSASVRVENGEGAGPGVASSLRPSRVVWSVGLGDLKNGDAAGLISLRQANHTAFSAADFQTSSLIYSAPSAEVQVRYGTGSASGSFQVYATQCLAQVNPLTGGPQGFTIKFYDPSQVTSTIVNNQWQMQQGAVAFQEFQVENSTPFAYTISSKLRITRTSRINSSGQSGTTVMRTELRQVSGQPTGTTLWEVIDWTTNAVSGSGGGAITPGSSWSRWKYTNETNGDLNEDITVYNASSVVASVTRNVYKQFAWGAELIKTTAGYGGSNPLVTQFDYHTSSAAWGSYTRLKHVIEPTGKWIRYDYYNDNARLGLVSATYEPWVNAPAAPTASDYNTGLVTTYDYDLDLSGVRKTRPSSITRKVNTTTVGLSTITYTDPTVYENVTMTYNGSTDTYSVARQLIEATRKDYSDASGFLTTVTRAYREDAGMGLLPNGQYEVTRGFLPGLPYDTTAPNQSKEVWTYTRGVSDPWFWGFTPVAEGTEWKITREQRGSSGPVVGLSTAESTILSSGGSVARRQEQVYGPSGWVITQTTRSIRLRSAVEEKSQINYGSTSVGTWIDLNTVVWSGGRVINSTDSTGVLTHFAYDDRGRVTSERLVAASGYPTASNDQWTLHTYDGADRETRTRISNSQSGDTGNLISEADYDTAGRVTERRTMGQSGWLRTAYRYFEGGNPRISKVYHPPGFSSGPTTVTEVCLDGRPASVTGTAQPPKHFTYAVETVDNIVRFRTQERLGSTAYGDGWTDTYTDWLGRTFQEVRPTTTGHTKDRRWYNSVGHLVSRQLLNQTSQAILAATRYVYGSMGQLTREGVDVSNNGSLDDLSIDRITTHNHDLVWMDSAWWLETTSKTLTDPTSTTSGVQTVVRRRMTGKTSTLRDETRTVDANSQTTTEKTIVDRPNQTVMRETTVPGSTTVAKSITKNGFLAQTVSPEGVTKTFSYDVYGRPTVTQGRESVLEEKVYYAGTSLVKNIQNAVFTPANPNLGQGFEWQILSYDSSGRLATHQTNNAGTWKTARYEYNGMGQVIHQWGDALTPAEYVYNSYGWRTNLRTYRNGSNWNASTWASAVSGTTPDTTTWTYQGATGLVTAKTDPASRTVDFTYNARNQVATRQWARKVNPNDPNSPRVTTTYTYCDSSGYRTGELSSVSYNDGTPTVSYNYTNWASSTTRTGAVQGIQDATGQRWFGYRLSDQQGDFEWVDQNFYGKTGTTGRGIWRQYDSLGRSTGFETGWGNDNDAIQKVTYGYDAATGRVEKIVGTIAGTTSRDFRYSYQGNSNLISAVYGYGFGFRREHQWASWRDTPDHVVTKWSGTTRFNFHYDYDWIDQRIGEDHNDELSTALMGAGAIDTDYLFNGRGELEWVNATHAGTQIANRYRDWVYDNAGNRDYENRTGTPNVDFVPNNLNQYTSVGSASHTYDHDGNLIGDGVWWYYWDGENRLKNASRVNSTQFLEFAYDYQGRRVRKVVRNASLQLVSDRRFVYDGWNVIAELDATQGGTAYSVANTFTWGLDLTGTIHGGGGVGGLLMVSGSNGHLLPIYDANGNVRGLLDSSTSNLKAAYGYSAHGEVLQAVNLGGGTAATANPIRFASKWYDAELGLYQYNHRYYNPATGRFLNRDPIAENGGLNLYGYCGNNPVDHWDYLGQSWFSKLFKKIGKWIKKNVTAIIGAALNFVPGIGPALSMAWNASVGLKYGGLKGLAIGLAGSFVGGKLPFGKNGLGMNIGGRIGGSVSNAFNFGASSFARTVVNGYFTGAASGGVSASLSGRNFWGGFRAGGTTGAILSGAGWIARNPGRAAEPILEIRDILWDSPRGPEGVVHLLEPIVGEMFEGPIPSSQDPGPLRVVELPPVPETFTWGDAQIDALYQRRLERIEQQSAENLRRAAWQRAWEAKRGALQTGQRYGERVGIVAGVAIGGWSLSTYFSAAATGAGSTGGGKSSWILLKLLEAILSFSDDPKLPPTPLPAPPPEYVPTPPPSGPSGPPGPPLP